MKLDQQPDASVVAKAAGDFARDGFCVIRSYFDRGEVEQLSDRLAHYIEHIAPGLPDHQKFFEDRTDPRSLIRLENMHQHDPWFASVATSPRTAGLAERLLGEAVDSKGLVLFGKRPITGTPTPAHQDGYYYFLQPPQAMMIWIPIDPADRHNGCIHYVPGSHRQGLREHRIGNTFGFSLGLADYTDADRDAEVVVEVHPGDLIAHHCLTIHRTDANSSERLRRALGLSFFARSAQPDEAARQAHAARVKQQWKDQGRL